MSDDAAQAERIRQLKERRTTSAAQPQGVRAKPKERKRRTAVATRAATGALSVSAFVAVTAAMGPVFAAQPVEEPLALPPVSTTTWAVPAPTLAYTASTPTTVADAPKTIIVQVRREYLVSNSGSTGQPGAAPAPSTGTSAAPSPAPGPAPAPAAPTATAAPAPPPPPPPTSSATTPPLTGGS